MGITASTFLENLELETKERSNGENEKKTEEFESHFYYLARKLLTLEKPLDLAKPQFPSL